MIGRFRVLIRVRIVVVLLVLIGFFMVCYSIIRFRYMIRSISMEVRCVF